MQACEHIARAWAGGCRLGVLLPGRTYSGNGVVEFAVKMVNDDPMLLPGYTLQFARTPPNRDGRRCRHSPLPPLPPPPSLPQW